VGQRLRHQPETGCVDALFAAQTEPDAQPWLGRNGMNGTGGAWPIRVGLNDQNAFYDGTQVQIGKNTAGAWIGSLDVLAHEMGHGIDDHTPGGISSRYAGVRRRHVRRGHRVVRQRAVRTTRRTSSSARRSTWSAAARSATCPTRRRSATRTATPAASRTEVHAAAGPGNHWFYLLAEGTNPTDGQPTSPTCNSTTSGRRHPQGHHDHVQRHADEDVGLVLPAYRVWTLQAAKNLFPGSCTEFNAVKAAWSAVNVPAQSGSRPAPRHAVADADGHPDRGTCSGQKLLNPGFESGSASWTATAGVIGQNGPSQPARTGTWNAWLDGYGTTHTDTLSQSVTIPAVAARR
jgi:hypothetical protein